MSAFVPKNLGTLSNNNLTVGVVVTVQITKNGVGQVLSAGVLTLSARRA
jgi:hypothetical protein